MLSSNRFADGIPWEMMNITFVNDMSDV